MTRIFHFCSILIFEVCPSDRTVFFIFHFSIQLIFCIAKAHTWLCFSSCSAATSFCRDESKEALSPFKPRAATCLCVSYIEVPYKILFEKYFFC